MIKTTFLTIQLIMLAQRNSICGLGSA